MYPVYLLEVHLSGTGLEAPAAAVPATAARDPEAILKKNKIWQNEVQTQTDPRKKELRSSCKFHMPKIWTQHQSKLLRRSPYKFASIFNLSR